MRAFFDWWFHQLAGLFPFAVTGGMDARPDAIILENDRHELNVSLRKRGETISAHRVPADEAGFREIPAAIAQFRDSSKLLLIGVPAAQVLQKRLALPMAAQRDLRNALGFEIERETPFEQEEVYWTHALRSRDAAAGKIAVDLILIPKGSVEPVISGLRDAGLTPSGLELDIGHGMPAFVPLEKDGQNRSWTRPHRSLLPLAAAAGALAMIALTTPFVVQQWDLMTADRAIATLSVAAGEAATLRQATDRLAATAAILDKERSQNGSALTTLAALTRALPDDSYLTAATVRGGKLTLTGMSPSAADLIGDLAQLKEFRGPTFEAPVTQSQQSELEAFTISVSIGEAGAL
jgi:general secretion pathway protein L